MCRLVGSSRERSGGVAAYGTRTPAVLARFGFPGGDGSCHHRGTSHRTLWQSDESGLRPYRVPQTTSRAVCAKGELGLPPRLSASFGCGRRRFSGARRAGRCVTQFDRLLPQWRTPQVAQSMMSELKCPSRSHRVWSRMPWRLPGNFGHTAFGRDRTSDCTQRRRDDSPAVQRRTSMFPQGSVASMNSRVSLTPGTGEGDGEVHQLDMSAPPRRRK